MRQSLFSISRVNATVPWERKKVATVPCVVVVVEAVNHFLKILCNIIQIF